MTGQRRSGGPTPDRRSLPGRLTSGRDLLEAGRPREAADAFSRLLLHQPDDVEARAGLAAARAALAEVQRLVEARLEEARSALEAGNPDQARALVEEALAQGADSDRAQALLDRIDPRTGRIASPAPFPISSSIEAPDPLPRQAGWARGAFVAGWVVVFGSLAAGVGASWDRLVDSLVRPPARASTSAESPGQRTLYQARRLLAEGEPGSALQALRGVAPEDPAFAEAERLRVLAEAALRGREPARDEAAP